MDREISSEKLPIHKNSRVDVPKESNGKQLTEDEITERIETILLERIKEGNKLALFQLGQLYFEQEEFDKAEKYFQKAADKGDLQSMFQLGIIFYDGLGSNKNYKNGFDCMMTIATSKDKQGQHLLTAAQYNVGRAYFQGFGVRQSDSEAERFWLLAADDGNPKASVKAQSMLGMFYSRPDSFDGKKAFFWHSEACGNGSLESQGALGIMYQNGIGVRKSNDSAFLCLREAAERGNVYAMGNLVAYYYKRKLYTKAVELAARVSLLTDIQQIAEETDCIPGFICKGIAMGCFYYGRLLHQGMGIRADEHLAVEHYKRCYSYDPDMCSTLQDLVQHGMI